MAEERYPKPAPVPDERGLIVPSHGRGRITPPWNSETGRSAVRVRMARAEAVARAALTNVAGSLAPSIAEEAKKSRNRAGLLAWGAVVAEQSKIALDHEAWGSTQAAKFVGTSTGYLPAYASQVAGAADGSGAGGVTIHIDAEAARLLLAELRSARGGVGPEPVQLGSGDKEDG